MSDATTLWLREDDVVAEPVTVDDDCAVPWPQRVLLDTVYVVTAFPTAWAFFVLVVTGLALSAGLAVVVGGVLMLPVVVMLARGNAFLERLRVRGMLRRAARTPAYLS